MKSHCLAAVILLLAAPALALDGQIGIHDPSTVVPCNGKYYTYGTGSGSLVSDDGWTWRRGTPPGRTGPAPDIIHVGDRYYVFVCTGAGVIVILNKTLDPDSPDYQWAEGGVVGPHDGAECNAIDPGAFLDPTDGRLWLTYGSYIGYIRLVELRSQDRQAPACGREAVGHRHQLRSYGHDLPRRLVLSLRHSRHLLHPRGLDLQYPHGPRQESDRPVPRQYGRRHAQGRRQALLRLRRPRHRSRAFRTARLRRRRAEVLLPL